MPTAAPMHHPCGHKPTAGRCPICQARYKTESDKRRPTAPRRGYTNAWHNAAKDFLARHPTCAMCPAKATTVDHIQPHRGDMKLFWDSRNWQPLCTHHHNSVKQRMERNHAQDDR